MSSPDRGSRNGPGSSAGRGCLSAAALAVGLLITVVIGYCGGGGVIHLFWRVVTGRAAHGDAEAMVVIAIITAVLLACGIGLIVLGIGSAIANETGSRLVTATTTGIPILETARLTLRGHRRTDFDAVAAMWGDLEVARHISDKPSTREESWARLLRYGGLWNFLGFGYWAVEEKGSGRFVGDVGLANFQRETEPPLGDLPEAGWVLSPSAHGKGYATEAVRAVLAWSDANLKTPVVCILASENPASIRVAEKSGFIKQGEGTYKTWPTWFYRREPAAR